MILRRLTLVIADEQASVAEALGRVLSDEFELGAPFHSVHQPGPIKRMIVGYDYPDPGAWHGLLSTPDHAVPPPNRGRRLDRGRPIGGCGGREVGPLG